MAIQTINIGQQPNDGTGDDVRVAFGKANDNFGELDQRTAAATAAAAAAQTDATQALADAAAAQSTADAALPIYQPGSIPTEDVGDIWVAGDGPYQWDSDEQEYAKVPNYNRSNIVGTVSQASGVPTGAIIERGSNANGEYVRFADGTQICWTATVQFSDVAITTPSAGGYRNAGTGAPSLTWPAAFSAAPKAYANIVASPDFNAMSVMTYAPAAASTRLLFFRASESTISIAANALAIGRWN